MLVMRLAAEPVLDEELVERYAASKAAFKLPKQSESGIRSRRAELARAERLIEAGRKKMSTGRQGRTWAVAPSRTCGGCGGEFPLDQPGTSIQNRGRCPRCSA